MALKVQTVLGHSHLKEEKARTKFLVKFKSTDTQKNLAKVLSCLIIRKGQTAGGEGRLFYLNFLYCESGFYVSFLLVNWKRLILFTKLLKLTNWNWNLTSSLKLGRREQRQKIIKNNSPITNQSEAWWLSHKSCIIWYCLFIIVILFLLLESRYTFHLL